MCLVNVSTCILLSCRSGNSGSELTLRPKSLRNFRKASHGIAELSLRCSFNLSLFKSFVLAMGCGTHLTIYPLVGSVRGSPSIYFLVLYLVAPIPKNLPSVAFATLQMALPKPGLYQHWCPIFLTIQKGFFQGRLASACASRRDLLWTSTEGYLRSDVSLPIALESKPLATAMLPFQKRNTRILNIFICSIWQPLVTCKRARVEQVATRKAARSPWPNESKSLRSMTARSTQEVCQTDNLMNALCQRCLFRKGQCHMWLYKRAHAG